jgi:hypothetical protein
MSVVPLSLADSTATTSDDAVAAGSYLLTLTP